MGNYRAPGLNEFGVNNRYLFGEKRLDQWYESSANPQVTPFIDFSTPPNVEDGYPSYIAIDLSFTVTKWSMYNEFVFLFKYFPLHDIIAQTLALSLNQALSPGHWDYLLFETENRLGPLMTQVHDDNLMIFFESIVSDVEEELNRNTKYFYNNTGCYVFFKWLDPVSICLCKDDNPNRPVIIGV